ncbi:hypothetical protein MKY59_12575 [Paenibacillus sp. FSL W8-0426]|uniref:hypothetical protein n=1 Tax=Paenibacillus sp. FSL W8-0426 TaxID=2921714 RepID=UPI0030DAD6BF
MFTHVYPHFQKGRILKTAMLEQLPDYPRDYLELCYRNYANALLPGRRSKCSVACSEGTVKQRTNRDDVCEE